MGQKIIQIQIKAIVEEYSGKISGLKFQSRNLTNELKSRIKQKEIIFQTINNTLELWLRVNNYGAHCNLSSLLVISEKNARSHQKFLKLS